MNEQDVLSHEDVASLREFLAPISPYFILFTARSGSTFLTHELVATNVLSTPHEWFNWEYVASACKEKGLRFPDYVRQVVSEKKSKNNNFGCEINLLQLTALKSIVNVQRLFTCRIRWFFLRRRNLVAQGISHFIAAKSRIYHSYQLKGNASQAIESVSYDADDIKWHVNEILRQEVEIERWLEGIHVRPILIYYEDVVSDPKGTACLFANVMGTWLPSEYVQRNGANPMTKIATTRNLEFEERFRTRESDFVGNALTRRPMVLSPAKTI